MNANDADIEQVGSAPQVSFFDSGGDRMWGLDAKDCRRLAKWLLAAAAYLEARGK